MPSTVLDVGIVGAGVAGLAAGIALRRAGHKTTIYERSTFKNEIGAAISFTPNANLILDRWGFDAKKAGETVKRCNRRMDPETLECQRFDDLTTVESEFGHKFNAFHRVDMHQEIRRLAEKAGAEIKLGSEVVDVVCEEGLFIFKDGTSVKKDLLVIADGVSNNFIKQVSGTLLTRQKLGKSIYRTLIPISKLLADPIVRPLYENQLSGFCTTLAPSKGVFMITYPCADDKIMNVAVFHTTPEHQRDADDWNSPATVEDALQPLQECFHPAWRAIIKNADVVKCFTIGKRDPLDRMVNGKAVLIGGAMGIEDAAALEILFRDFDPTHPVEQRLALFNQLRLPRTHATQLLSNAMLYHHESPEDLVERIREHYSGPVLSPKTDSWTKEIRNFFYAYDAFAEAEKAVKYLGVEGGLPEGVVQHFGLGEDWEARRAERPYRTVSTA